MKYLFFLTVTFIGLQAWAEDSFLTQSATPGQCYPSSPQVKEYLFEKKFLTYIKRQFRCHFQCVNANGDIVPVKGIQSVSVWLGEDGDEFVCRGYETGMIWVETPMSTSSWGYYTIGDRTPFNAEGSKIAELETWFKENFN